MEKHIETNQWFPLALTLVFVTLKLTNHIDWSWWWVLAPLWAPYAVLLALFLILWGWSKIL